MAIKINNTTIIDNDRNIVNAGVITATSFSGDGSGLTGVGVGASDNISTTGIITASVMSANEFVGTGDKLIFSPSITSFSPTDGATGVSASSSPNIVLTYDQLIILGVGTITLRKNSSTGEIVENFQVGVSTRVTTNNQTLTIDPTNNFDYEQEYYVVIPQTAITNSVKGNPGTALTTYNFTSESAPTLSSVVPANGATNIGVTTNITFTFNKNVRAGVGTITLRTVSAGGTIVESYNVSSSNRLTFSGNTLTIDPTANLNYSTVYYVVIPSSTVAGYAGISTYNFTSKNVALGDPYEGGILICQSGGVRWVLAPSSTETYGYWDTSSPVTNAQSITGCTGWFLPTIDQLLNPGYTCRQYWDVVSPNNGGSYWSSTQINASYACAAAIGSSGCFIARKDNSFNYGRAFRTVNY